MAEGHAEPGFFLNDLVWAKMKGYPPWPGTIAIPANVPQAEKKGYKFIYFYGTGNYSWIPTKNIQHHSPALLSNIPKRKPKFFQIAVDKIVELYESRGPHAERSYIPLHSSSANDEESVNGQDLPDPLESCSESANSPETSLDSPECAESPEPFLESPERAESPEPFLESPERAETPECAESLETCLETPECEESKEICLQSPERAKSPETGLESTKTHESSQEMAELGNSRIDTQERCQDIAEPGSSRTKTHDSSQEIAEAATNRRKSAKAVINRRKSAEAATNQRKSAETASDIGLSQSLHSITILSVDSLQQMTSNDVDAKAASPLSVNLGAKTKLKNGLGDQALPEDAATSMDSGGDSVSKPDKMIGFVGFNDLSCSMMKNLLNKHHKVMFWCDVENKGRQCGKFRRLGAQMCEKAADLSAACDILFCCMSNPDTLHDNFFGQDGVLSGLQSVGRKPHGTSYVEFTSTTDELAISIQDALHANNHHYMRAEIISGSGAPEKGELAFVVSGDVLLLSECKSVLDNVAAEVRCLSGEIQNLARLRSLMLTFNALNIVGLAETLKGVKKIGINTGDYLNRLQKLGLITPFLHRKGLEMDQGNYRTDYPIREVLKEVNKCLSIKNCESLFNMSLLVNCRDQLNLAVDEGKGDHDLAAVFDIL